MFGKTFTVVVAAVAIVSQYALGVDLRVIRVRQTPGKTAMTLPAQLPSTDGYLAVMDCSEIGNIWYLQHESSEVIESFLVIDCAGHVETRQWMTRNNIIGEVDYQTAVRWDVVGIGAKVERITYEWRYKYE